MSDAVILEDEDPREFHSPFDLALDWAAFEAFKWLVLGHILFVIGLALVLYFQVPNGAIWATPLLAAPLVWKGRQHRLWTKAAVLLIGFTAAHYLGVQAALATHRQTGLLPEPSLLAGFAGGAVGAAASLGLCALFGLLRSGAATLVFAVFGTVLLAMTGSLTVYLYLTTGASGETPFEALVQLLKIYTPWQILFAYVLAKVLRPDG